jgi:hypothetical protein
LLPLIHRFGASGGSAGVLTVEIGIVLAMWSALKSKGIELWPRSRSTQNRVCVEAKESSNAFTC